MKGEPDDEEDACRICLRVSTSRTRLAQAGSKWGDRQGPVKTPPAAMGARTEHDETKNECCEGGAASDGWHEAAGASGSRTEHA